MATRQPPDRLESDLVVLVRLEPLHLDGLQAAVEASHVELQRWMDWAGDQPQSIETTREWLVDKTNDWNTGNEFTYAMTDPLTGEYIGTCTLMSRPGPGRLEIGYWVRSDRAAAGVATAAAALLTDTGLAVNGIDIVEIHHDAANRASGRIAEKLGYTEMARVDVEADDPRQAGVDVKWEITRAARP